MTMIISKKKNYFDSNYQNYCRVLYGNKITSLQSRLFEGLTSLQVSIVMIVIQSSLSIVMIAMLNLIIMIIISFSAVVDQRKQD